MTELTAMELTEITSAQALELVGKLILQLLEHAPQNSDDEASDPSFRKFWLKNIPSIAIDAYLHRFDRYCPSSAATYLTAGSLMHMVIIELQTIPISKRNAYRLFSAAFIISAKLVEDKLYSMKRYATTAGLSKSDLAQLEILLLDLLKFRISDDREFLIAQLKKWTELGV